MPRLIRRLAKFLEADAAGKVIYRQTRRKPLKKPEPAPLAERPRPILGTGRIHSFLLDTNYIIDKEAYYLPKEPPPVLPSQKRQRELVDGRRLMNPIEVEIMTSPYARMLSSPLRTCIFTRAILPKDLLIRFGGALDPETGTHYLLPNDIEHPKFVKKVGGTNFWISCWKEAVEQAIATKKYGMVIPGLTADNQLLQQTEHLLQQRVIQELRLLRDRLRSTPQRLTDTSETVITQLTRPEQKGLVNGDGYPLSGVSAILVLPEPGQEATAETIQNEKPVYFSHLVQDQSAMEPRRSVPLYNLASLPVDVVQNARQLIGHLMEIERRARVKVGSNENTITPSGRTHDADGDSGVYFLRSTSSTLPRADVVPLCIALWRLRLWAGHGWNGGLWGKWENTSSGNKSSEKA